ncbi:MAG: RDD family protein [Microbacterium sp.]|nr:MAG: RDD family protein [Microbacterium sp.]
MLRHRRYPGKVTDAARENSYPGERLGLPATGVGSIGRVGRRIGALAIDWACAVIVSIAFFSYDSLATLTIFAVVQIVFLPTLGGSPGHRLVGLRLQLVGGGWVGLWRPIVRTALLCLVIPAVIWDVDQRGLHDKAAGTVLLRR